MYKKTLLSLAVASSMTLTGCIGSTESGDGDSAGNNPNAAGKTWPIFNPAAGELPIPSDLNFDSEAGDGSFGVDGDMSNPVIGALNNLSGASTVAPAVIRLNGEIDPESVDSRAFILTDPQDPTSVVPNPNQNVFLIEVEYASGAPVRALSAGEPPTIPLAITFQVAAGLLTGTDLSGRDQQEAVTYLAGLAESPAYDHDVVELDGTSAIRIRPRKPLDPLTRYVAIVTDGVKEVDGETSITQSPVYEFLTDESSNVPGPLAAVETLINSFWETIGGNYFALNNFARGNLELPALDAENIALSYSFTTSGDKEVLSYIGNSANWISDQLERGTKFGEASLRVRAATVFGAVAEGEPTGIDPEAIGLDETATDAEVIAAIITALDKDPATESVETTDFMAPGREGDPSEFGFADVAYYVGVAVASFTPSEVDPQLAPCDGASEGSPASIPTIGTFTSEFACAGALVEANLDGQLAGNQLSLEEPAARSINIESTTDALQVSAIISSLDIESGEVDVHQGSISLPQYIAVPDATQTGETSTIRTQSWRPNPTIAGAVGTGLGASIPQADADVSTVLNYNYPFPAKQEDVEVPMLIITPTGENPTVQGSNLVPVIYQHGITTDRSAALTFGSQLVASAQDAGINIALFAIDQPLHGVSPFTREDQEELSLTLLVGGGIIDEPPVGEDGEPEIPEADQATIDSVIDGEFANNLIAAIALGLPPVDALAETPCADALYTGLPGSDGTISLEDARTNVLSGDCGVPAATQLGSALVLENTVANAGSTIAGLAPANTATGWQDGEVNERHYGFTAGSDGNPIAMDFQAGVGSSGSLFINLTNFPNNRDILRQGAVDLMNLTATVNSLEGVTQDGVVFIGHSLGTLNGGAFVGASTASGNSDLFVRGAHLLTPVAGVTRLLENSPSFAPTILGGLQQAASLAQGDADLETFLNVNQASLDAVDPINFADELAVSNVVLAQIDLDRTTPNAADTFFDRDGLDLGPLDLTFPNGLDVNSPTAPLTGSEALAFLMGAEATGNPLSFPAITRYAEGVHSTPVLPLEEIAVAPSADGFSVLKNRTIATGGEVIVSGPDAQATFSTMIGQTIGLIQATGL